MEVGGSSSAVASTTPTTTSSVVALRPVIFVVDATAYTQSSPPPPSPAVDEPFDVRRSNSNSQLDKFNDTDNSIENDDNNDDDNDLYDKFLSALQGKLPNDNNEEDASQSIANNNSILLEDDALSIAASFASSAPPTPRDELDGTTTASSPALSSSTTSKRFLSPFSRLRKGWRTAVVDGGGGGGDDSNQQQTTQHYELAHDIEHDPDFDNETTSSSTNPSSVGGSSDNVSSALSSYSKDNPPVHFISKRARIVCVSNKHAFPPSKFPMGKMNPNASGVGPVSGVGSTMMLGEHAINTTAQAGGGNNSNWMSCYEIQNEGILPIGWLEKHARALPSSIVIVTTLKLHGDEQTKQQYIRSWIQHATKSVENVRVTLAEKRNVPIHLVCLIKEENNGDDNNETSSANKRLFNVIKEKLCQECYLSQSQVFMIRTPCDLEPDEFECGILRSPYLDTSGGGGVVAASSSSSNPTATTTGTTSSDVDKVMMNPLLRKLDRSLRDSSALYYSNLAEAQEKKLLLWRNRYHTTNTSFEVNTLLAAMRCARYSMKVGTLREFQMRTGGFVKGGVVGSNGRWTDKSSLAMRHYDEAYRWIIELHRRAIAWRATALSSSSSSGDGGGGPRGMSSFQSPGGPVTPGNKYYPSMESPKLIESPGGGIGVELSYPGGGAAEAAHHPPAAPSMSSATPPPPPMRRNSPALTSKKGYNTAENIAFFALLWEQCRAVASIINAKLLRTTSSSSSSSSSSFGTEAMEQWSRHRIIFLGNPYGVPNFLPSTNDDFFGPAWHRFVYVTEELLTFACIAEGRWRRAALRKNSGIITPSFHQIGAPWLAYGELSEAILGLRKLVLQQMGGAEEYSTEWMTSTLSGRRRFVGSLVAGDSGFGTLPWRFENESKRDHRVMSLDYVLHALDLMDENTSLSGGGSEDSQLLPMPSSDSPPKQPMSSARLHYLAGRLLMSLNDPTGAWVHLNIAAAQTKSWPSLNLSIQRALSTCNDRCPTLENVPTNAESKVSSIELLLQSDSCKLLSSVEMKDVQARAWEHDPSGGTDLTKEVVWNHDDTGKENPPFEFAVSFLKGTHATSSDTVKACVSIKSCLDFQVNVESIQLLTTSGIYDISNLEQCAADRSQLQSWIRGEDASSSDKQVSSLGVELNSNDLAFFLTELSLPSNLSDITLGGIDTSKFIPKNGRLCNTGYSHAAGNICESRFDIDSQQKISINGKPIPIFSVSEASSSFIGGVPMVCHGIVLKLKSGDSSLKLQIDRPSLVSPLLRSGTQRSLMEESNYTAHSWSRPTFHPWCLGPRVLRVLGPRPYMHVTNLTDELTLGKAVEGTVNRIMLRLDAGCDEDCWDVRVRLKCNSYKKKPQSSEVPTAEEATTPEYAALDVEPNRMPTFVQKAEDATTEVVTENGVSLPAGWEVRKDVGSDESHDVTTSLSPHIEAGKSLLCPLDIFRSLDSSVKSDTFTCSTSYDVIITYRQVRAGKGLNKSDGSSGDQVMVMQSGIIEWITPFTAEFSQTNGHQRPYPCGIQHASNQVTAQSLPEPSGELVVADGQQIQMKCSIKPNGLGPNVAASILNVTNEKESDEKRKMLYSTGSGFLNQMTKKGSKLSLSYSVSAQNDIESANVKETIPLGIISVRWKPASLNLPDDLVSTPHKTDEFGSAHGPLNLPNLTPMIFYGPQCHVLPSPFSARLLKCPSTPKVGTPFCVTYKITNRTAKSQTLVLHLNDVQDEDTSNPGNPPQLLGSGKLKEESQLAPFEEKTFSYTFMSMVAGKVLRPPLTVSSGRHQTWVINETLLSSRYLFVMP